ncbi:MAG: nicotinamide riboside transporter PnuC [Clostridiales bacterium]|nr:nicotinamide riboside transporter PnuC [Clostridiales bacterium]
MKKNTKNPIYCIKVFLVVILTILTVFFAVKGFTAVFSAADDYRYERTETFYRQTTADEEGYDDDSTKCEVEYANADKSVFMVVTYTYEDWQKLGDETETIGYLYANSDGFEVASPQKMSVKDIQPVARDSLFNENSGSFGIAIACGLMAIAFFIMTIWNNFFSAYEKCWFLSIIVLASVISLILPEESCNGVNGLYIMILYLLDTFLNILCELLISKQSKWNFVVSLFVEITEIAICLVLAYRFATMVSTLFFWIPIDIVSFINWHKHPDKKEEELTKVRSLSGLAEVLIILGIIVWTAGVGYFLTTLDFGTDLFHGNETLEVIVCYLDACVTAVAICNGLFIFFRIREQWIAWFIDAILEGVINILSGQWVLLILKLGYITNSTYGFIKWTKYIKTHEPEEKKLSF